MSTRTSAVLWDIDGTLLRAAGTGVRTFSIALEIVTGLAFPDTAIDMGGRTDPDIASLVLAALGIDDDAVLTRVLAEVEAAYALLEHEFRPLTVAKPGVADALDRLQQQGAVQTIVSGNLQSVARRKVAAVGLDTHIRFELGGYGSDHRVRSELVRTSMNRIAAGGHVVDLDRVWVVGDTPRDLQCARETGVRCALVATGTHTFEELAGLGADATFTDLADTEAFLDLVLAD
ncbi:MAG: family hydrolase [Ilumatobacteraceae bacterium]|nr:family hydrolase [Ilumatobacteraceae bacterium]